MEEEKLIIDMDNIRDLLNESIEYNLEVEVVTFALKYMKENPDLTIIEAFVMGYNEWIK